MFSGYNAASSSLFSWNKPTEKKSKNRRKTWTSAVAINEFGFDWRKASPSINCHWSREDEATNNKLEIVLLPFSKSKKNLSRILLLKQNK